MKLQVPVGGCYRLIDVPMSNCINSGINKIFVLTQFNSASLNRHIARTYFGNGINFGDGFVEVQLFTETMICLIVLVSVAGETYSAGKSGSCSHPNTWRSRRKMVPGYSRCCTTVHMGF